MRPLRQRVAWRRLGLLVLLFMSAAAVAACGQAEPTVTPTPTSTATPVPTATPTTTPLPTPTSTVPPPPPAGTSTPFPSPTPTPTPPPTPTPLGVSPELESALDGIIATVVALRELELLHDVDRSFMTRVELEAFLREELEEDREEILEDQELLAVLGLIPQDMDLYQLILDLYTEQVLGLYDTDTDQMYVIGESEELGPLEETTFAHEYVHALQQQHFDIHALLESMEDDSEASAALIALVEGDAYLLHFRYVIEILGLETVQAARGPDEGSPVFDGAPYAVKQHFLFPAVQGIPFVTALFLTGGLNAVNAAYSDPPVSTEQVLHLEKYLEREKPRPVSLPDIAGALGAGWREIDSDVLGEFFLRTYLETGIEDGLALDAAAGWAGDRYALLEGPQGERVFVALTVWDRTREASQFSRVAVAPLADIPGVAFSGVLRNEVLIIVAPSETLVERVRALFPGF